MLLVLDYLTAKAYESVVNIFTKSYHHRNVTVFFLTRNLFHKNMHMRTMNLKAHYLILFKNYQDVTQFATLARQMYSTNWRFFLDAFNDATSGVLSYLLVDLKTETENDYHLRINIFAGEPTYVYVSKR